MNRGSSDALERVRELRIAFNEAPIHESGKSDSGSRPLTVAYSLQ